MWRFGLPELIIILVILLMIFGAGRLPQVGGALGKAFREFRRGHSGSGMEEAASAKGDSGEAESTGSDAGAQQEK